MRNKYILSVFFMILSIVGPAQVPEWQWASSIKGQGDDITVDVTTDRNGNVYIIGTFTSPYVVFGIDTLIRTGSLAGAVNTFIVKYDPAGNVIWTKSIGSNTGDELGIGIE